MEIRILDLNSVPGDIVRLYRFVTTLEEVAPDLSAAVGFKFREELTNKAIGNTVLQGPTAIKALCHRYYKLFLLNQTYKVIAVETHTDVQATVGVALDVKITLITADRAEEKLQAAV